MPGLWMPPNINDSPQWRARGTERRQRDHMSRQFTYVTHASTSPTPPHLNESEVQHGSDNITADSFHVGSPRAARITQGPGVFTNQIPYYMHTYRINRNAMSPVMFGDTHEDDDGRLDYALKGIQPGLFESAPLDHNMMKDNEAKESPQVLPYRNSAEDVGSISYAVPKATIGKGVEFLGTADGMTFDPNMATFQEQMDMLNSRTAGTEKEKESK